MPRGMGRHAVLGAPRRIVEARGEPGEQEAGDAGHEEGRPPAEPVVDGAAEHVPGGRADRDGGGEDREHPAALLDGEVVGEQGRRHRAVGRLPHPDRRARDEQADEAPREAAEGGREAPDGHPGRDQPRAPAAVAERAEDRRGQHVDQDEAGREPAELAVREAEPFGNRPLQALDQRRDDEAVEVVEEVDEQTGCRRLRLQRIAILGVRIVDRHPLAPQLLADLLPGDRVVLRAALDGRASAACRRDGAGRGGRGCSGRSRRAPLSSVM